MNEWQQKLRCWVCDACVAEVSFRKPGNVSPGYEFHNATAEDFIRSADAAAPAIAKVEESGVGAAILSAVQATHRTVGHNTNLGIVLLLTPLAAVPPQQSLDAGIEKVLSSLTVEDAELTYQAIAAASPGGLGQADSQDVRDRPTGDLRYCMNLAADRDLVAAQYANGFRDVLEYGVSRLMESRLWPEDFAEWRMAWLAVSLLSQYGDSLIQRKCGSEMDGQVRKRAQSLLSSGWPFVDRHVAMYENFDEFLRADGNRRNPGATADMIAAILFAAFREGWCSTGESATNLRFDDSKSDV